jgi:hypothetical protein
VLQFWLAIDPIELSWLQNLIVECVLSRFCGGVLKLNFVADFKLSRCHFFVHDTFFIISLAGALRDLFHREKNQE